MRADARHARIPVDSGALDAYVATATATGTAPVVVVIGSVFGVTPALEDECDRLAAAGYHAIAPDLFWRTIPGPLTRDADDRVKAMERYAQFDVDAGLEDIAAVLRFGADVSSNGHSAIFGYCFGGRYAFLGATRLGIDAGISFHGTKIGEDLAEAPQVGAPLSLHFGEADDSVPMSEVAAIAAAFADRPDVGIYTYPGCRHGFAQPDAPSYDVAASTEAMRRSLALLATLR